MLSCAQELKRRVVASANASFAFMVFEFISAEMLVARGKSSGERGLEKNGKSGGGGRKPPPHLRMRFLACGRIFPYPVIDERMVSHTQGAAGRAGGF